MSRIDFETYHPEWLKRVIEVEELPLYQDAARQAGFQVLPIAQAGSDFKLWYGGGHLITPHEDKHIEEKPFIVNIHEGKVGIIVVGPKGQENHKPFLEALGFLQINEDKDSTIILA